MDQNISKPAGADLTQYEHIQCFDPKHNFVLQARRTVGDEQTPTRWAYMVEGTLKGWWSLDWDKDVLKPYFSTDELKARAKELRFGEWQAAL